jgi:hypothetical protein
MVRRSRGSIMAKFFAELKRRRIFRVAADGGKRRLAAIFAGILDVSWLRFAC